MRRTSYGTGWLKMLIAFLINAGHVQLRKVYIRNTNDNPQDLHLSAASLATNAFYFAFPCEES